MLKLATFSWYLHSDLQTGCFSRNMEASKQNWYSQNWHHVFNFKRCAVISWHQQRALLRMERMTTTNLNFLCCSFAGCNESRIKQRKPALLPTGRNFLSNVKKDEQMRWHFCFRHVCQQLRRSWISECDRFPYDSSARNLSQILADMEIFAKWKKKLWAIFLRQVELIYYFVGGSFHQCGTRYRAQPADRNITTVGSDVIMTSHVVTVVFARW